MKITLISGSHRPEAQTFKVATYLQNQLEKRDDVDATSMIELGGTPIPYWDESFWQKGSDLRKDMEPWLEELRTADAFVVCTPEWGGMVPGALKNFMLYWSENETGHKPGLIVTDSAGINGAYPVAELRGHGYKNAKICYIPEHLIVRNVSNMMNDDSRDPDHNKHDADIKDRADYALNMLMVYARAFKDIREAEGIFDQRYPFGM
jgi:NAD(P)H-dependent FMN reductase